MFHKFCVSLGLPFILLLSAYPAQSQEGFNVQTFAPSPFPGPTLSVIPAGDAPLIQGDGWQWSGAWNAGLMANFQNGPLVSSSGTNVVGQNPDGEELFSLDLYGSYRFTKWLALALNLPVHPLGFDFVYSPTAGYLPLTGRDKLIFGDLSLSALITLLHESQHLISLAVAGTLQIPTGTPENFLGDETLQGGATVIAARSFGDVSLTANLGLLTRPDLQFFNVTVGDEFLYSGAVDWRFDPDWELIGELKGRTTAEEFWSATEQSPLEALTAVRWQFLKGWSATGGLGVGMLDGIGVSDYRVLAGVQYAWKPGKQTPPPAPVAAPAPAPTPTPEPTPEPVAPAPAGYPGDRDGDRIADVVDACPDVPEVYNGVRDEDGCPEKYWVHLRLVNTGGELLPAKVSFQPPTAEGAHFADFNGDRLIDAGNHGDYAVRFERPIGDPFSIAFRILPQDEFLRVETVLVDSPSVVRDATGPKSQVRIVRRRFTTQFAFDSAAVPQADRPTLIELATYLKEHPEIHQVTLQGHTDAMGSDAYNMKLSERRAASVKKFLTVRGIADERLKVVAYGESQPVADNLSDDGRSKNRRVEIILLERVVESFSN